MSFARPEALVLLILAVPIGLWSRASCVNLPGWRRKAELGLRLGMLAALMLALAGPRAGIPGMGTHFLWLVDVSASASAEGADLARDFLERSGVAETSGELLAFARHLAPPEEEAKNAGIERMRTAVGETCLEALAFFPEGKGRVLTVFTDCVAADEWDEEAADQLKEHGVHVFVVPIPRSELPEVGVRRLRAPAQVREGEPFSVEAEIAARKTSGLVARVEVDGLRAGEKEMESAGPVERLVFDLRAPSAERVRVVVSVEADADTLPQNNSASCEIAVRGRPRLLAVSERGLPELRNALGSQGIEVDVRPAMGMPGTAAALEGFEAVILDADAMAQLGKNRWQALENYVRGGGGLLFLGGPEAWSHGKDSESLLPLEPKAPRIQEIPSLALVLVIDKSGSMQGEKLDMAKSAALATLEILAPGDLAGVVVFDSAASWALELGRVGKAGNAPAGLGTISAGGGTHLASGLSLALEGLRAVDAQLKHVVVLSDGVSSPGPHRELAARMRAAGITLSTVGVGKDVDLILLEQLARMGGGRFYYTETAGGLPRVFLRETALAAGTGTSEEPSRVVAARRAPFLRGVALDQAPLLLGHVRSVPRPEANVWLVMDGGDPLLATRRVGLGQVAAWASSTSSPWAAEWIRWPGYGAFWAQVLREIMPPPGFREMETRWRQSGDGLELAVRQPGLSAEAVVEAQVSLQGRPEQPVRLLPSSPGEFTACFPMPQPGICAARVATESAGRRGLRGYASLEIRPADDGVLEEPNWKALASFAEKTGGKFDPEPAEVAAANPPAHPLTLELWPWLAGLALALFLAGLAVRRLGGN